MIDTSMDDAKNLGQRIKDLEIQALKEKRVLEKELLTSITAAINEFQSSTGLTINAIQVHIDSRELESGCRYYSLRDVKIGLDLHNPRK